MNSDQIEMMEIVFLSVEHEEEQMPLCVWRPKGRAVLPACILLPEIFGITEDMQAAAKRLAQMGFIVIVPDLHYRIAPNTVLAMDDAGRSRGLELLQKMTRSHVIADITVVHTYSRQRPDCSGDVSVIGFSAGGHIAYLAATELPFQIAVILYGGWIGTTGVPLSQPQPTVALTPRMAALGVRVLYIVGAEDHLISKEERSSIRNALSTAGIDHELIVHEGVQHGFMFPGRLSFNEPARHKTWEKIQATLLLFKQAAVR